MSILNKLVMLISIATLFHLEVIAQGTDCSNATNLTVGTSCTTQQFTVDENGSLALQWCATGTGYESEWLTFTASSSSTTIQVSGSNQDFMIGVANDCSSAQIDCINVTSGSNGSLVIPTVAGNSYVIQIQRTSALASGSTTKQDLLGNICAFETPTPITNDDPCGAITLPITATCTFSTYTNTNATATAGVGSPSCSSYGGGDVWFQITVPANGSIEIDSDVIDFSDGAMAVYTGTCGSLTELQCNDDGSSNGLMPLISVTNLTPGSTLWVRFWEYAGGSEGDFSLCVTSPTPPVPPTPPSNDDCLNATTLTPNPGATCTTVTPGTIAGATGSLQASGCFGTDDDDVWYSFTATSTSHTINLLNITGSTSDLYHSVYSGTCSSIGSPITCSDPNSSNITGLTIGNVYYVRIYSWTSTSGQTSTFDVCLGTPPPPPVNVSCPQMEPICSGSPIAFTAQSNGGTAELGNSYDCLSTQPNPSWYYFEVAQSGDLAIDITASSDIDFALWGPYADVATAEANCGSLPFPIDCSYSSSAIELADVANVNVGEVYVLLVTNYADITQTIFLNEAASNTALTDCSIVPLPVGLEMIVANRVGSTVILDWTTNTETNCKHYEIQKSNNGLDWRTTGIVHGNGTSQDQHDYQFTDKNPFVSESYYRYKQVDFDGNFTYSPIVSVNEINGQSIEVFPNPADSKVYVKGDLSKAESIRVISVDGKIKEVKITSNGNLSTFETASFENGLYLLEVSYFNKTETVRFTVNH